MKFLSFENNGHPVVTIKSTSKKLNNKVIHLDDKARSLHGFNELKLKGDDSFQLIPNPKIERSINYVCGSSGSGKTWWIKQFLIEYKKTFPKNEIYVFSPFPEADKSFDGVKVSYIKIDNELLEDNLTPQDFKDSMVVMDDIEAISDRTLNKEVHRIADAILTTGRHYHVSCCLVFHEACNGQKSKKILNESHTITIFLRTLGKRAMKYLLENYLGLGTDEINRLKKIKTRALTIVKGYPKLAVGEKEIICLNCDDDSDSDGSSEDSDSDVLKYESKKKKKIKKKY